MKSSRLSFPAAALAVGLALAGCTGGASDGSGDGASDGSGDGVTTLRVLIGQGVALSSFEDDMQADVANFEKLNPGIKVDLEIMLNDQLRTVLQTRLRSGNGPDVFEYDTGPAYAGALQEAGLVYDLSAAYESKGWPIYEFAKPRVTFGGEIVALPFEMESVGIWYNKDIFEELGIEPPANLADLEDAAQTIKDAGIIPFAISDQEGWEGGHILSMILSSQVGEAGLDALITGEESWDSQPVIDSLQVIADFNEKGFFNPSPTGTAYDVGNSLYYSGEAAMNLTGSWQLSEIEAGVDFAYAYIPFPGPDSEGIFASGLGRGLLISAASKNTDAAIAYLDYQVTQEHAKWFIETFGKVPVFPVDTAGIDASPVLLKMLDDSTAVADGGGEMGSNIDVLMGVQFNDAMWAGIQGILAGTETAEGVAANLEAAAQADQS